MAFLDFNLTDDEEYHSVYRLRDKKGREFSDQLEIHVIELNKKVTKKDRVGDWIAFFNAESEEELDMLSSRSIGLREAVRELKEMSLPKYLRAIYEERQKEIRDQKAWETYLRDEGYAEGVAQEQANTERERLRADQMEAENRRLREELEQYKEL